MTDVVLHQWEISPFCGKVRKVLHLKGIAYRVENYNGLRARKVARLSQAGTLPVLDWGPQRVADSSTIASFLDQRQPTPPPYPLDPREAALARTLEDWAGTSLYNYAVYFRVEYAQPREQAITLLCEGRPRWECALFAPAYTRQLRRHDWLVGGAPSIADIAVSAMLDEMLRTSTLADRIRHRPNVARWLAQQGSH